MNDEAKAGLVGFEMSEPPAAKVASMVRAKVGDVGRINNTKDERVDADRRIAVEPDEILQKKAAEGGLTIHGERVAGIEEELCPLLDKKVAGENAAAAKYAFLDEGEARVSIAGIIEDKDTRTGLENAGVAREWYLCFKPRALGHLDQEV